MSASLVGSEMCIRDRNTRATPECWEELCELDLCEEAYEAEQVAKGGEGGDGERQLQQQRLTCRQAEPVVTEA
eukprot:14788560-Alexandrium_andersonii.AAC.1